MKDLLMVEAGSYRWAAAALNVRLRSSNEDAAVIQVGPFAHTQYSCVAVIIPPLGDPERGGPP